MHFQFKKRAVQTSFQPKYFQKQTSPQLFPILKVITLCRCSCYSCSSRAKLQLTCHFFIMSTPALNLKFNTAVCHSSPLLQMWVPGNTDGFRVPRLPGRTCDAPSGWWPHTGAPPHHPARRRERSIIKAKKLFDSDLSKVNKTRQEGNNLYWLRLVASRTQNQNIPTDI